MVSTLNEDDDVEEQLAQQTEQLQASTSAALGNVLLSRARPVEVIVNNEHPFDLEAYISPYSGTRIIHDTRPV
jgi:hypothetical protein